MDFSNNKIKTAVIFIFVLAIGIGVPLFSRLRGTDLQAALPSPQPQQTISPSPTPPSIPLQNLPSISCSANPPAVYVGDQVIWTVTTQNINYPDQLTYIWSGAVTGQGMSVNSTHNMAGTFSAKVQYDHWELGHAEANCSVNVLQNPATTPSPSPSPSPSPTPTPSPSPTPSAPTPPAESASTSTLSEQGTEPVDLTPAPDIISCKMISPTVIINQGRIAVIRCTLTPPGLITVRVVKGEYTPPNEPDPASIIKTLSYEKSVYDQVFSYNWNGIDSYDAPAPDGDYSFVVSARQTVGSKADISVQKFQVMQNAPETQEATQETETGTAGQEATQTQAASQTPSPPPEPPKPPEPSKCPGVNYPNDIETHWAREYIKLAYDNCIFRGYDDGTFRPDQPIMRGEAVKAALVAAGIPPKLGCYDADCGTPFEDLLPWHGQWLRAAWDMKIVKGIGESLFIPLRPITRGEGAVLIAKAFRIPPHQGCFTANCGAGHPNNFFLDIADPTQGSYLRALWDRQIIQGSGPNSFEPNRQMTRAEMAKFIIKAGQVTGTLTVEQSSTPATAPSPASLTETQETTIQQQTTGS